MRAALFACVVALAGCATVIPPPYAVVPNGGLQPAGEVCDDLNLRVADDRVELLARGTWKCPGDASARQPALTATYGYWRTSTSAGLVGPAPSNRVVLKLLPLLVTGQSERAIADGSRARAIEDGSRAKQLADAGRTRREPGLATGQRDKDLAAGQRAKDLGDGAKARALAEGAASRPVIAIVKAFLQPHVFEGNDGRFEIVVRHIGTDPILHLVVVDRVDPRLELVVPPGARSGKLADGSMLLVFEEREPFNPGETRRYEVSFHVPSREPK